MINFKQHKEMVELEEGIGLELAERLLPKKVLHWLKRALHKDAYIGVLKLQKTIMKSRAISAEQALVKAAETYGINPREMFKVLDRETRHA